MNQGQGVMNAVQAQNAYAPNQAIKVSQVEQEMGRMDNDVGRLEKAVETLTERLTGVLRSQPPLQTSEGGKEIAEVLVPRADAIRHVRNRITQVSNQIDSILARLET